MSEANAATAAGVDWSFQTPRIHARLVDDRDRDLYRSLYTDESVMAHIGAPLSVEDADGVFGKVLGYNAENPLRARYWRLSDIASGSDMGLLSNVRDRHESGVIELGIMLLPSWQGRGMGLEILVKIIDLLMSDRWELDIHTVIARNAPRNLRAACLTSRLGFETTASSHAQEGWLLTRQEWLGTSNG